MQNYARTIVAMMAITLPLYVGWAATTMMTAFTSAMFALSMITGLTVGAFYVWLAIDAPSYYAWSRSFNRWLMKQPDGLVFAVSIGAAAIICGPNLWMFAMMVMDLFLATGIAWWLTIINFIVGALCIAYLIKVGSTDEVIHDTLRNI